MKMWTLYEFPQSHFCEKVRWALDVKSVPWTSARLIPGLHRLQAKKIAAQTSLPILQGEKEVIQGSHQILSYIDTHFTHVDLGTRESSEALDLEKKLDEMLGNPLILCVYYWLFQYPSLVNHYYMDGMPSWKRALFRALFPLLNQRIQKKYGLTKENYLGWRKKLDEGLVWLDRLLEGKRYLFGDQFSRADITAASMLAILDRPKEHPYSWETRFRPKEVQDLYSQIKDHACFKWSCDLYCTHRNLVF